MHTNLNWEAFPKFHAVALARPLVVAGILLVQAQMAGAVIINPGGGGGTNSSPTPVQLGSWSFHDPVGWTNDSGHAPISFTNLAYSFLGNGSSLVVNTNVPAWLQYNLVESDGTTNLNLTNGSLSFWFAPAAWASTNAGGNGPGPSGAQLINVGQWTADASYGYWGLSVDPEGANLWFQTQDGAGNTYSLAAPISWTTNYFHSVTLTYCGTNVAIYLDGGLATNDPGGLNIVPTAAALAGGINFGSDTNGLTQANGMFNNVVTYNAALDAGTVQQTFSAAYPYYLLSPLNWAMFTLSNALSSPSWTNGFSAITGVGDLQYTGPSASGCVYGANPDQVWFTNVTAIATNGGTSLSFTIAGGAPGYYYDVFATGALQKPLTNSICFWLGQGQTCNTYTVNIISRNAFFILGTPQSSCACGLTDAYLSLVAKVSPAAGAEDGYGVPYAWYAENGLVPITSGLATTDSDGDGLLNYQEYLYGTKPNVSEGFSVWTALNGTTAIP
jgi:hypothetical protein